MPYEQMARDLAELVGTIQRPHLRELLRRLLHSSTRTGATITRRRRRSTTTRPTGTGCSSTACRSRRGSAPWPPPFRASTATSRSPARCCTTSARSRRTPRNGAIELTDDGKLLGEIPLGYYTVRRTIEDIDAFPKADADALLHIILSHHGKLEHGSPVVPCTREATLVHFIDNLGGNLGSFDRIEKSLADGARWSDFDRGISTAAYFGSRTSEREAA